MVERLAVLVVLTVSSVFAQDGRGGSSQGDAALTEALEAATQDLVHFNFSQGRERFAAVADEAQAGSAAWQRAMYGQALCAQHLAPPTLAHLQEASRLLQDLLAVTPQSPLAPAAMLTLGRIAQLQDVPQDTVDLPLARHWYQQVIDRWPQEAIADEAMLRLGASYILVHDDAQSVARGMKLLETWLERRPDNPLASIMWQYLGETALMQLQDDARALACYLKVEQLGPTEPETAGTLYGRMAVLAERTRQWPLAVGLYQKILIEAPRSGRAFEAQLALQRLQKDHPLLDIDIPPLRLFQPRQDPKDQTPEEREAADAAGRPPDAQRSGTESAHG